MPHDPLLKLFMPPAATQAQPQQNGTQHKNGTQQRNGGQQSKQKQDAQAALRDARELCDYAWKTLEDIKKDYDQAISKWETQFGEVLAAVGVANDERDKTIQRVKDERARDAAKAAFINNLVFSLLTVGAMSYLGEFVKAGLPKMQFGKQTSAIVDDKTFWVDKFKNDSYFTAKITTQKAVVTKSPFQFNQFQANVFGDIAKDSGHAIAALNFPKPPEAVPYSIDSYGGLESLRADITNNIEGSKQIVIKTFKDIQQWLNQVPEFGEAWLAYANGNKEVARDRILRHIETQRGKWATEWEFFGRTPMDISRPLLAEFYERAWWATYIIKVLTFFPNNKEMNPESPYYRTISQIGRGGRKLLEKAIVDRLRDLNVVFAETERGVVAQIHKVNHQGSPVPEINIGGAIEGDEANEALVAYKWATHYVAQASKVAEIKYFPPSRKRDLDALKRVRY